MHYMHNFSQKTARHASNTTYINYLLVFLVLFVFNIIRFIYRLTRAHIKLLHILYTFAKGKTRVSPVFAIYCHVSAEL